jgi:hypothetical protein
VSTIAYDKPVKDLISQLSATGHVTHTSYKKTSVTIHHNGGRLSHEGVLNVWKTREASAHFDVDAKGNVAQYVKANEYAWAVGNKSGNQTSISIEQANSTVKPTWEVAEITWQETARLAGWLFAHVVDGHPRPSKSNLFYHKHWSATDCAGPYMDKVYDQVLAAAQKSYDSFVTIKPSAPKPSAPVKKSVEVIAHEVITGKWGNGPDRKRRLITAGYNYNAVQAEVNVLLNAAATNHAVKKSIQTLAAEVIAGKWGNNPGRSEKLKANGYNADAVQAEVNRRLAH